MQCTHGCTLLVTSVLLEPALYQCDALAGVNDWVGSVGTEMLLCWTAAFATAFCTLICVGGWVCV